MPGYPIILLIAFLSFSPLQAQETRSVSLQLDLDWPSKKDLQVEVTVRNHTISVVPPAFIVVRPIISTASTVVVIPSGQNGLNLTVTGVSEVAVNYSIEIRCLNCEGILPTQFYGLANGVSRSERFLNSSTYLTLGDLENLAALRLNTFAFVSGTVLLKSEKPSQRSANVKLTLLDSQSRVLTGATTIVKAAEKKSQDFLIDGLVRRDNVGYVVLVECNQCDPSFVLLENTLPANESHTELNIQLMLSPPTISGVMSILLDDD